MSQGTPLWAMPGTRTTRQVTMAEHHVATPPGSESKLRHRGTEQGHNGGPHGRRQVEWRRVVRHQATGSPDDCCRLSQTESAGRADRLPATGCYDRMRERDVFAATHNDRHSIERRCELTVVGPALRCPHGTGCNDGKAGPHTMVCQPGIGCVQVSRSQRETHRRRLPAEGAGQRQQPLDLVSGRGPRNSLGVGHRRGTVGESDARGSAGPYGQCRRPDRAVWKIDPAVCPGSEHRGHRVKASPPPGRTVLVVRQHLGNRGMALQQIRCRKRGDDIDRTVPLSEHREKRGGEDHVAEEGGLDY
jgi:hypothetical protein